MKTAPLTVLLVCLFLLAAAPQGDAGWVEIDAEESRTLFSGGKIKNMADDEGSWSVFDTTTGELMMADDELAIYTRAEVDDYCQAIIAATEEALEQMSEQERELLEQLMRRDDETPMPEVDVTVESLGEGEAIAGHVTERYRVLVNGFPYQDLWIAPGAPVLEEIDISGLQGYQRRMSSCMEEATPWAIGPTPEASPDYEALLRTGWVMRSIQYGGAGEIVTENEVVRLEQEEIAPNEFEDPAEYRRVSVKEFMEARH